MKKLLFCIWASLLTLTAHAQTVTVPDIEALPGETVNIAVSLSEGKPDTYTAFSFDVQFPSAGFSTTSDYTVASAWKGVSAVIGDVDASGRATVAFASANEIAGAAVNNLVTVAIKVDESVGIGAYSVTLSNILLEYGIADKDYVSDVTFMLNVVNAHTVVLNEESSTAPEAAEGVNVRVLRTIKAGQWSTICLPFAMSESQMKEAFGSDVQLADFEGCVATYDEAEENVLALEVNFSDVTAMDANHPYIIKVAKAVSQFEVANVDISPEEEPSVDKDELKYTYMVGKKTYTGYMYNRFIGTYAAQTEIPENNLFLSGNKFWYSKGQTTSKAFRGYFDFYDILAEVDNADARISMNFPDDGPTGISVVETDNVYNKKGTYDMQGRRVKSPAKGLYIMNGKKIIIK